MSQGASFVINQARGKITEKSEERKVTQKGFIKVMVNRITRKAKSSKILI